MTPKLSRKTSWALLMVAVALLLSLAVVSVQVDDLGLRFIRVQQEKVHQEMLAGVAGNPWQYRILADLLMEPLLVQATHLGIRNPTASTFIAFRFAQCVLILFIAGIFYRRLGLSPIASLLGLSVLAWGMALCLYNSDLSFNVFFDVAFYLLAGVLILDKRYVWVAILMLPAALNRETSLLIPILLVCHAWANRAPGTFPRDAFWAAGLGLAIYAVIFIGVRLYYGPQNFLTADGYYPGLSLLLVNLRRGSTWQQLLVTLGIIPILAAMSYARWPLSLRVFFWTLVPLWIGVHFLAALVAEARLMLVPQALVLIPGGLSGLASAPGPPSESA